MTRENIAIFPYIYSTPAELPIEILDGNTALTRDPIAIWHALDGFKIWPPDRQEMAT